MKTVQRIWLLISLMAGSAALIVPTRGAELKIVAAENFYGGIAQQIAGDHAQVLSILTNPNQDPHEFSTNAATAKAVADADIIIYSGIDYDSWMEKLLGTKGKAGRVVINVSSLIGAKSGDNPHIWYDPKAMTSLAGRLVETLAERDPSQAVLYQQRLIDWQAALKPVFDQIASIRSARQGTAVTATEPVFGYMAQALGLKMLNEEFQVSMMNDTEPSASQTAAFEQCLRTKTAKVLFYNSQVTDPTTERLQRLARESGVPVVGVTETQPPDQKTYAAWMQNELNLVQAALKNGP